MKQSSELETMRRVWAVEQIKDLMSRRALYSANEERSRELEELWVQDPEHRDSAAFGRNDGYYVGMKAIWTYYVEQHKARLESLDGMGYMECHAVSSPYVELAGDGRSARGLWYSIGQETYPGPDGRPRGLWVNDKVAADFLLEESGWRIWHLVLSNDVWHPAGLPMGAMPDKLPAELDWIAAEFGQPTIPMVVHNPLYLWSDDYPAIPKPYDTMTAAYSYGPEGHPRYRKGDVR